MTALGITWNLRRYLECTCCLMYLQAHIISTNTWRKCQLSHESIQHGALDMAGPV